MTRDKEFREMNVASRISKTDEKVQRVIETMLDYDLTPCSKWFGENLEFSNLGGTKSDFCGADISIKSEIGEWKIQDKWRASGNDLGIEIVRMYWYEQEAEDLVIVDGGRDIFQIPPTPIVYSGNLLAERDWIKTRTKSDYYLFHSKKENSPRVFIQTKAVKKISENLFKSWVKNFEKIEPSLMLNIFVNNNSFRSTDYTIEVEAKEGIEVKCLREPVRAYGSKKKVIIDSNEPKLCWIAKSIAYIPLTCFLEDEIAFCPKRN